MSKSKPFFIALLLFMAAPLFAAAQTTSLTPEEALKLAIEANPDLQITLIDIERADLLVEREETARVPLWVTDLGYRYGYTPQLSPAGTRLIDSSSLGLTTRLVHTLPAGTQVSAYASMGRASRDSVELGELGVAYDAAVGVDVTQPLLRGFGTDIVDASIRSARLSRQALDAQQQAQISAVFYDVLATYWDLWLAQQSLAIQEASLELSRQNLENAQIRLETGVLATAQLIPLRTEVATAEERLAAIRNQVQQRSTELARLLGQDPRQGYSAVAEAAPTLAIPDLDATVELYREQSFELLRQEAIIEQARIQAALAKNDALPRLDAIGSLQVSGLDRDALGPFGQIGRLEGWVAFAGLRLELPINNRSRQAEAERAELALRSAEMERDRTIHLLDAQVITLLNEARTSRQRAELARVTAELARENVEAQTARFETGRGTTLEVVDAIQRQQEAELRVVETEVDVLRRLLAIDNLTGQLLNRWGL